MPIFDLIGGCIFWPLAALLAWLWHFVFLWALSFLGLPPSLANIAAWMMGLCSAIPTMQVPLAILGNGDWRSRESRGCLGIVLSLWLAGIVSCLAAVGAVLWATKFGIAPRDLFYVFMLSAFGIFIVLMGVIIKVLEKMPPRKREDETFS